MDKQNLSNFPGHLTVACEAVKLRDSIKAGDETLSDRFKREVFEDKRFAWYVDFYTVNPGRYACRYLCENPLIKVTNEALCGRDPDDSPGDDTKWGSGDVSEWFRDDSGVVHGMVFSFHTKDGETHSLTLSSKVADLDGDDRWAEYVELGIKGALRPYEDSFDSLANIQTFEFVAED